MVQDPTSYSPTFLLRSANLRKMWEENEVEHHLVGGGYITEPALESLGVIVEIVKTIIIIW